MAERYKWFCQQRRSYAPSLQGSELPPSITPPEEDTPEEDTPEEDIAPRQIAWSAAAQGVTEEAPMRSRRAQYSAKRSELARPVATLRPRLRFCA